jgi:hypothetical protein
MFDPLIHRLGAILGKHDPRALQLRHYITKARLAPAPPLVDWREPAAYQMFGNDAVGDCVIAAEFNFMAGSAALTCQNLKLTREGALADYGAITGYDPATGANDNGTDPNDALKFWSHLPVGDPRKVLAYAEVNLKDLEEVRSAIQIFGGIYLSLAMPKSAQAQVGGVWDVDWWPEPWDAIPGTWGGHQVEWPYLDMRGSKLGIEVATWGAMQAMTAAFLDKYATAGRVRVTAQLVAETGLSPAGLNLEQLLFDAASLQAAPSLSLK